MEAETGIMVPQAKEHKGLPEAKRDKKGSSKLFSLWYFVMEAQANEYNWL